MIEQEAISARLRQLSDAINRADYQSVLIAASDILALGGHSPDLYYAMAVAFLNLGHTEKAKWATSEALSLQPNHANAYALSLAFDREMLTHPAAIDTRTKCDHQTQETFVSLQDLGTSGTILCEHVFPALGNAQPLGCTSLREAYLVGDHRLRFTLEGHPLQEQAYGVFNENFHNHRTGLYRQHFKTLVEFNEKLRGQYVCLSGPWSENFYHWVCDYLPQVIVAETSGFRGSYLIEETNRLARESLPFLGIGQERITLLRTHCYQVEELFIPHYYKFEQLAEYQGLLRAVRDTLLEHCPHTRNDFPKRIFSSRGTDSLRRARVVVNENEVLQQLANFGIERVEMEHYSFAEQIEMMSKVDVCIGPHGAGMTHALLMPEDSLVVELFSAGYINLCVSSICDLVQHRYYSVIAKPKAQNDNKTIVAPVRQLQRILERELSPASKTARFKPTGGLDPLRLLELS